MTTVPGDDDRPEGDPLDGGSLPPDFDFDAEFAKAFGTDGGASSGESDGPTASRTPVPRAIVAVVLTPVSSAPALAGLCAMAGLAVHVVPTGRGALAAAVIERDEDSDGLAELLGEAPALATQMATTLSRTSRFGAVLLVSRLGDGDEGLVGSIAASQWHAGSRTDEQVSAGLVLAQADDVVEQLLFGTLSPTDAPGVVDPGRLPPWQARRLFKKTQRKPRP